MMGLNAFLLQVPAFASFAFTSLRIMSGNLVPKIEIMLHAVAHHMSTPIFNKMGMDTFVIIAEFAFLGRILTHWYKKNVSIRVNTS